MRALSFVWSLLNITGHLVKQHIVVNTPPQIADRLNLLTQTLSGGADPFFSERKLIRFSNENFNIKQEKSITTIPLAYIFQSRGVFPQFHSFSRSHYARFTQSYYADLMTYPDFCAMEDKLADVVFQYLDDKKSHWTILLDDPFFLECDSLRSYGSKQSVLTDTTWITTYKTSCNDMIFFGPDRDNHI